MSNELSLNINRILNDIKSKSNDFANNLYETKLNYSNNNSNNKLSEDDISSRNNELRLSDENISLDSIISRKKKNLRIIPVKTLVNESNFINFFKVILVALCFAFFAWNVYYMGNRYLSYDTVTTFQYKPPDESDLPGITICGPFIINPKELRKITKEYVDSYNASDTELARQDLTFMKHKKEDFSLKEGRVLENVTARLILTNLSLKYDDLIMDCVFMNYTIENDNHDFDMMGEPKDCMTITDVVQSIYEGRKCFTLFSRLNSFKQNGLKMIYEFNPMIKLTVKTRDYLWSYGNKEEPILMAVHPKTLIPTHLDFDYFTINNQFLYQVYFRKKNSTLKPYPWKTNCHNYLHDCGCRMRQICLEECIRNLSFPINDCINWNGVITEKILTDSDQFCPNSLQNYTVYVEARKECEKRCRPECYQIIYEMYGNTVNLEDRNTLCNNEDSKDCNATIKIMLHQSPTIIIEHMEGYEWEDFVGAVGGHLGIWLSLSFITIIDLLLTLMEKSFKLIKRRINKQE